MPPLASSNRPTLSRSAPVNAPLTWPNSSLSSRLGDRAAQWTLTNGRPARGLVVVDRLGEQLLAGAALAADQHRGRAGGDLAHLLQELAHLRAGADDAGRMKEEG